MVSIPAPGLCDAWTDRLNRGNANQSYIERAVVQVPERGPRPGASDAAEPHVPARKRRRLRHPEGARPERPWHGPGRVAHHDPRPLRQNLLRRRRSLFPWVRHPPVSALQHVMEHVCSGVQQLLIFIAAVWLHVRCAQSTGRSEKLGRLDARWCGGRLLVLVDTCVAGQCCLQIGLHAFSMPCAGNMEGRRLCPVQLWRLRPL